MVKPYSFDLRTRVVEAHLAGDSIRSVAARYGVSVSSVPKWVARYRETGSVAPGKIGGYRRSVLDPHRAFILEQVRQTPHLTLMKLQALLAEEGVAVSHDTIWRFLKREGLSFKKSPVRA